MVRTRDSFKKSGKKVKLFSMRQYLEEALRKAEYERDENGVIIASVPGAQGFFAQGDSSEQARENLRDVIEGNLLLALQMGWDIPAMPGITIEERDVKARAS